MSAEPTAGGGAHLEYLNETRARLVEAREMIVRAIGSLHQVGARAPEVELQLDTLYLQICLLVNAVDLATISHA